MINNDYGTQKVEFDTHKRKCEELRKIRMQMARTLGVPELVRDEPCNYSGQCHGTCPACYMEEKALMDRIYELLKSGVVLTIKGSEFEKESETMLPPAKPPIIYNPPIPPMPPIVQGLIRPLPPDGFETPAFPTPPIPEPEKKKRGIFDKIKKEK